VIPALSQGHDLQLLALQGDVTRVITFQLARETSTRTYPEIGVPEAHHPLTHNGGNAGTVSAFSVAGDGALSSIGTSPYPDLQPAPCWVEISQDGSYLFTVNTAGPSISSYSIAATGALTLLGSTPFASPVGVGPEDARLSPDGETLFVVDTAADALSAFAVSGGDLTELAARTPLPAGAAPFGIVVT